MTKAQARLKDGHTNHTANAIDEAIEELKNVIAENEKIKVMGASAPDEEPLGNRMLLLNENEKVFWQEAYIHAMKIRSSLINANMIPVLESREIADNAILELRLRLGSNLKKELINDN